MALAPMLSLSLAGLLFGAPLQPAARRPVLLELFTSEGCSSCPPADEAVRRLAEEQPVEGVEVIVLGEHVDYWNRLGWRDPFSSELFSGRQEAYAHLAAGRIYTPQAVVDGAFAVPANDGAALRSALLAARERRQGTLSLSARRKGDSVLVEAAAASLPADGRLLVALVEEGLTVRVTSGENEGRTLTHAAVVRSLQTLGESKAGAVRGEAAFALAAEQPAARLRVVAFVQMPGGAVLASKAARLEGP
jgi:hypothetical protein